MKISNAGPWYLKNKKKLNQRKLKKIKLYFIKGSGTVYILETGYELEAK